MRNGTTRALLHTPPLAAVFALACALLAHASPPVARRARRASQEQEQVKKETPPANSAVYGRVVYDDTSRPVRRARVLLVDEVGSRPEYNALTDADGAFRIEGVRAGSFFAFVDVPGVLSPVGFVRVAEMRGRVAGTVTVEAGKQEAYGSLSLRRVPDGAARDARGGRDERVRGHGGREVETRLTSGRA
jgi:hypothetical protein